MKLRASHVLKFWKWLNRILFIIALVWGVSLLLGCAPYWTKTHDPVEFKQVVVKDCPCANCGYAGCVVRSTGSIEIKPNMTPEQRRCVLQHELKHLAGYSHPPARGAEFSRDCGDGSIWMVSP